MSVKTHLKNPEGLEEAGVREEGPVTDGYAVPAPEAQQKINEMRV